MIEKMKRLTLVALKDDQETTLNTLRSLEVLHIQHRDEESQEFADKIREVEDLQTAIRGIAEYRFEDNADAGDFANLGSDELTAKATELLKTISEKNELLNQLNHEIDEVAPWGDFQPRDILALRERGIDVRLCVSKELQMPELPEGAVRKDIATIKGTVYYAVICNDAIEDELPEIKLPEHSISELRDQVAQTEAQLTGLKADLARAACLLPRIEQELEKQTESVDYLKARDSMGSEGRLEYITGYIPKSRKSEVIQMAHRRGWALVIDDPADDDPNVPTLLRIPNWLNISKPIFDFVGISPGYREWDISLPFLVFLTLFFGMIVGDAGYGVIFLTTAVICRFRAKTEKAKLVSALFVLMSSATLIWGILTGSLFGIPEATLRKLPSFMHWICGIKALTDPATKNQNVQYICFMIAAVHLSMARLWKAFLYLNKLKIALGNIGWAMLIWGNFFTAVELIVFKDSFPRFAIGLYGVGLVLVTLFAVNWKDPGDILNYPFGLIGSFVDVLSYIRLFAVGLSTMYIAQSFNNMGIMVLGISQRLFPLLLLGAVLVILVGHVLNILLAVMGVLVHGIRLNTLEFSNHMELEWAGRAFSPFKKRHKSK